MINYLNSIYLHTHETVLQTETTNRAIIYQLKKEKRKMELDIEALANVFLKKLLSPVLLYFPLGCGAGCLFYILFTTCATVAIRQPICFL